MRGREGGRQFASMVFCGGWVGEGSRAVHEAALDAAFDGLLSQVGRGKGPYIGGSRRVTARSHSRSATLWSSSDQT
jgi:hypothetical protein